MKVNKAVILAAGMGKRLKPYSVAVPKEMLAIADKPALQLIVEEIALSGIKEICIVVSPNKSVIENYFSSGAFLESYIGDGVLKRSMSDTKIVFVTQQRADGTANAVKLAKDFTRGEPFAVCNGDDVIFNERYPAVKQLVGAFEKKRASIVGVQSVSRKEIVKYASAEIAETDGRFGLLKDLREKPQNAYEIGSLLAPLGRYVLTQDVFKYIDETESDENGERVLTDVLRTMLRSQAVYAYEFDGDRFDVGDKSGYIRCFTRYAFSDERFKEQYRQYLLSLLNKK